MKVESVCKCVSCAALERRLQSAVILPALHSWVTKSTIAKCRMIKTKINKLHKFWPLWRQRSGNIQTLIWKLNLTKSISIVLSRMSNLDPPNLWVRFQYILARCAKCTVIWIEKVPALSHLVSIWPTLEPIWHPCTISTWLFWMMKIWTLCSSFKYFSI